MDGQVKRFRVEKKKESKFKGLKYAGVLVVALCMICGSFGYLLGASGPTGFGTVIEPGVWSMMPIADIRGFRNILCEKWSDRRDRLHGVDAIALFDSVFSSLDTSRTEMAIIGLSGQFAVSPATSTWALDVPDWTYIYGQNSSIRLADSSSQTHLGIIGINDGHNIVIDGLTIDGNMAGQVDNGGDSYQRGISVKTSAGETSHNITIKNCHVVDVTRVAISAISLNYYPSHGYNRDIVVSNNKVENGRITGNSLERCQYDHNYISGTKEAGGIEVLGTSYNNIISRNIIIDSANDGIQLYGSVTSHTLKYNLISDNQIINPGHIGIYVTGAFCNGQITHTTIQNNVVTDSSLQAIGLSASEYNNVIGNLIKNVSTANGAVSLSKVNYTSVIGNQICAGNVYGLAVHGSSHNTISGNIITAQTVGVRLAINSGIESTYNIISNNVITQGEETSTVDKGVAEYDASDYNKILGNTFSDCVVGVYLIGTHSTVFGNIGWVTEHRGQSLNQVRSTPLSSTWSCSDSNSRFGIWKQHRDWILCGNCGH